MNYEYNVLNLLSSVKTGTTLKASYTYLADGTKLRVADASGNGFYYLGSLTYVKNSAGIQLEGATTASGRILVAAGSRVGTEIRYFLTDHLGSVRSIVDQSGTVKERNDYYPFGARHVRADYAQQGGNRYKYNGKEDQTTGNLGFLDYGARMYDAELGRWFCVDILTEKYFSLTPYVYCYNNPINAFDPNGMDGVLLVWKDYPAGGIPYTGHAGVLLINNKTGVTKYYEYGRYDIAQLGFVNHYSVPNVIMDKNNRPTAESLNKVIKFISEQSGKKKGKVYDASGFYFESDKFDEMNSFAQSRLKENENKERKKYSLLTNNCGDFATDVLKQDDRISKRAPWFQVPDPYSLTKQYRGISDYNFLYNYGIGITINYNDQTTRYDEKEKKTSSEQNWWQRLWYGKEK